MEIYKDEIEGLLLIKPDVFVDNRGFSGILLSEKIYGCGYRLSIYTR